MKNVNMQVSKRPTRDVKEMLRSETEMRPSLLAFSLTGDRDQDLQFLRPRTLILGPRPRYPKPKLRHFSRPYIKHMRFQGNSKVEQFNSLTYSLTS